jgi:hypothetical protein
MATGIFYRNLRARDQLEVFLLSAVSSLLLVRFYLHITGYPQIGGGGLHIAHMLWGGALMLLALTVALSFLGARVHRIIAVVGGAGFGVFIDELGKFITHDNDYFYQPAIGLIYAIFIILYLTFNFLSRSLPHTSRTYQLNALAQLEEAIVHDMDPTEKARVAELLAKADPQDPLTRQLQKLLASIRTTQPARPIKVRRAIQWFDAKYEAFWKNRNSQLLVRSFFLLQIFLFVSGVAGTVYANLDGLLTLFDGDTSFSLWLAVGQLISVIVAAGYVVWGTVLLPRSHMRAYEQFRRATLVNLFLTQFFMFSRIEFGAMPGFLFNMALLGLIAYAIRQEQRLTATNKKHSDTIAP